MINKHVIGRLGNQMFQYATVRAFQMKYYPNEKIILDLAKFIQGIMLDIGKNYRILE